MELKNKCEERTFFFVESDAIKPSDGRNVKIEFINHHNREWKFEGCKFNVENIPYNLKDWRFLKKVAEKIEELSTTLNS